MVKKYVLGFAFNSRRDKVVLVKKDRPEWQKGFFNGVGGKLEKFETASDAMSREFEEETGVSIPVAGWELFTTMVFPNDVMGGLAYVYCYRVFTDGVFDCKTVESEEIEIVNIDDLDKYPIISNLNFLIPMALDNNIISSEVYLK